LSSHPVRRSARAFSATLALAVALVAGGCSASASSPSISASPSAPVVTTTASPTVAPDPTPFASLIDDEGTVVEIPAEPQRIVSLTPATTEILFALGAGPRVVATTDFDDYPPEAVALPDVASYQAVDVEKIVGLEADLVVAGGNSFNDPTALERLRQLGVPVLVVYAPTIDGVLHDIQLIGNAVGRGEAASDLAAEMRAGFDQVGSAVSGLDRPRVFYELDATSTIYTAAADSFVAEMIERAGGTPITTGSPTDFAIPLEDLIAADPEVIVLGDAAYGVTAEAVAGRAGWAVMTAVREGAIRPADDIVVTRPGPRLVDGLRELARAIHPEADIPVAQP
jgi:iron complex transport system substrate-binding protein